MFITRVVLEWNGFPPFSGTRMLVLTLNGRNYYILITRYEDGFAIADLPLDDELDVFVLGYFIRGGPIEQINTTILLYLDDDIVFSRQLIAGNNIEGGAIRIPDTNINSIENGQLINFNQNQQNRIIINGRYNPYQQRFGMNRGNPMMLNYGRRRF